MPFVSTPTPGEGQWHVIGRAVDGVPTIYAAFLRPNAVNTSLVTGVAWMDTKLLSAQLYAGTSIPGTGQTFAAEAPITGAALTTLDAAFNSGFRMQDANGGFYLDGTTAVPLRPGAASLVIDNAGNVEHRRLGHRRDHDPVHRGRAPEPRPDRRQRRAGARARRQRQHPVGRHPRRQGPGVAVRASG